MRKEYPEKVGVGWAIVCFLFANDGGLLLSAVAIVQSIPIFSETGKFSLGLPNPLNVTIQFSFLLQLYLIALFLGKILSCVFHC